MTRRAFAGVLLSAILLGATWPTLAALPAVPGRIVAGDVYAITQGSGDPSINESLVTNLTAQRWTDLVSPEILSPGTIAGESVLVRGAEPYTFVRMEAGVWVHEASVFDRWAFAGEGLATRLELDPGAYITLVGSSIPRIAFAQVSGIFRTDTPANDELVVDFATARTLTGVGPAAYHTIRVMTSEPDTLVTFLDGTGASVHLTGPGIPRLDIHSDPPTDERITNLLLRSGRAGAPRDYLSSLIGETTTSVRVVAYGIAALIAALVAFGIHAVQARGFADRRRAVGVLRAVGAGGRWLRRRMLREVVPVALLAGAVGAGVGFLIDALLWPSANVVVFGHAIPATLDPVVFVAIVLAIVGSSMVSSLRLLYPALRVRPTETIREQPAVEPPRSLEVVLRG